MKRIAKYVTGYLFGVAIVAVADDYWNAGRTLGPVWKRF